MFLEFDKIATKFVDGEKIEYGFIFGSDKIVFMKVGADQDIRKYQDHFNIYIEAANRAHKQSGATIIVASNPDVPHEYVDEKAICWAARRQGYEKFKLYLWGISDGAYKNLALAKRFPETRKFIGLNTSFISFEGLEQKLQELSHVKKVLIYGTKDDEIEMIFPRLRDEQEDDLKIIFVPGADHRFTGLPLSIIYSIDLIEDFDDTSQVSYGRCWMGTGVSFVQQ